MSHNRSIYYVGNCCLSLVVIVMVVMVMVVMVIVVMVMVVMPHL